jgi:quercetin dioxygenase-like cupin family protein
LIRLPRARLKETTIMIARPALAILLLAVTAIAAWAADDPLKSTVLLQSSTTNTGDALAYPKTDKAEVTTMIVEIAPGTSTVLHRHPVPSVAYMLQGDLEVQADGGIVNRYKTGDAFLETIGRTHKGTNIGTVPVRILVTYIGVKGEPVTVAP